MAVEFNKIINKKKKNIYEKKSILLLYACWNVIKKRNREKYMKKREREKKYINVL